MIFLRTSLIIFACAISELYFLCLTEEINGSVTYLEICLVSTILPIAAYTMTRILAFRDEMKEMDELASRTELRCHACDCLLERRVPSAPSSPQVNVATISAPYSVVNNGDPTLML